MNTEKRGACKPRTDEFPDGENDGHAAVDTETPKTPKQRRTLSPKRLLRRVGRGMALIRNEKHDSSTDKHEQFLDSSHENRKDKYEYLKKKGKRHDNQRNNGVNTYISYRDSEADIEYEIVKWNKVRSANRQADQSINLADKGREQDQEAQCWLEATEPFSDEQLDIKANRIEPTHGNSGAVKARKQCGGTSSSMQRTEQRHAEHSDALRQEEQNSATIIGNKCDVEIIGKAGDVVKLNRGSGDKTCLLGISSLKTETRLGTREHRLNSVSKADTVDKRITNQCTNDIGLEDAKDKAFGKKRVLTEIMSNAYSMNNNHSAITRDLNDLEVDMKGSYHQDFSRKLKKYHMNGLKDNVTVNKSTEDSKQDYKNGNHHCKESETLSPKRLLSDEQIFQDEKRSAEETNNVGIQGETNGQHTGHERSNNDISKTGKVSAQEQKVHRFIDETDNHDETPYLDNTVKSAYEELNVSRHGTFSDKTDFEIEKQTEEKKLDVPIKTDHCSEIPYIRQKNGKGKQLNKDNYATESRAALKAMTKSNLLHRRHSSEGALDSRLEDLFLETRWRPLSTDFQDYVAIVAIDFGTAYSGYAYCFTNHTDMIYMMRKPEGGDPGIYNQKSPTSILLTPERKFHSFGYSARDQFHDLDQKESQNWMYFERFKMMLHSSENITTDTKLVSDGGKEVTALTVFSYGLSYFKDHALRELSDQSGLRITSDVIKWVVTVPAIWSASAKQFMRQAAYNAGLVSPENHDHLLIALEPEAASLYCLRQRLLHPAEFGAADDISEMFSPSASLESLFTTDSNAGIGLWWRDNGYNCAQNRQLKEIHKAVGGPIGSIDIRYMIVDCGGGTTDITVHKIDNNGRLREIHKAVGGPFGSIGIDKEFESLLYAVFGKDTMQLFKTKRPAGWVDLMTGFESRKRGTGPYRRTSTMVSLPFSFMEFFKRRKGHSVETAVKKCGSKDITYTSSGMLRISPALMCRLFYPTINSIKQEIGTILNHPDTRGLSYLLLVGGLAESSMLQHEVRKEFGHILKIIIPQGVSTITAKGAVLYGLNPDVIIQRRSRLTYGVGVLRRFKPEKHPADKRIVKDGIAWCSDILDHFVSVDQCVDIGERVVRSYTPVRQGQTSTIINIYSTEKTDAEFITDPGVKHCGTLRLSLNTDDDRVSSEAAYKAQRDITGGRLDSSARNTGRREIRATMLFGDTEITVTAVDMRTGRIVNADIDFLNS